jgi:hypothetical protein
MDDKIYSFIGRTIMSIALPLIGKLLYDKLTANIKNRKDD